jgi:integrase
MEAVRKGTAQMATVRKRKWTTAAGEAREAWIATYNDQAGKRHIETFKTKKAATDWLDQTKIDVRDKIHTPKRGSISVAEAGEAWIAEAKVADLEASTVRQYRQHLDHHIKPFLGPVKLSDLSPASIKSFRNALLTDGRSRVMAKKVVSSLGSILVDAIASGRVARNVVHESALQGHKRRQRGVEKRQQREIEAGRDFPTKAEMLDILVAAEKTAGKWHALILTAAFTGLRASELRGLTWRDIDTDQKLLTVRQRADRWNEIGSPKSKSARRSVPLATAVASALGDWRKVCPEGDHDLVFPNRVGKIETLPSIHRRGLGPIQVKAGISTDKLRPKYGMHAFRHFAASLFSEYLPPKRVQALMGHSTISMTLDVYTHLFPNADGDQAVLLKIEQGLGLAA